ncbi:MAG: DUF4899 domain-containing protein [Spirochaetes bacterium]|nr:MAG: DUF4899 domain-containing protein [Spirochaetota bacterium]
MTPDQVSDKAQEDGFFIIKARFKAQALNLYGLVLVVFNRKNQIDNFNVVVSSSAALFDFEPHIGWEKYEEAIMGTKWEGNFNTSMTTSIMDQVKTLTYQDKQRVLLYDSIAAYDYDSVEIFMSDLIYRIIHDKNLILEIGLQEVTVDAFKDAKESRATPREAQPKAQVASPSSNFKVEDGSVILPLVPILAPVKGKPLYELRVGDRIMTRILANSDREQYFIDLLDLRTENHVKPVPSEIIDIKANSKTDPIEILVEIGPGIYGRVIEEERQVKLRMYDPQTDGPLTRKGIEKAKTGKAPAAKARSADEPSGIFRMNYLIYVLFAIIVVIFTILVFLSL